MNSKWKLRRGQAMSIQWTCFLLQKSKIKLDDPNDKIIEILLDHSLDAGNKKDYNSLKLGCEISVNFLLSFAIELALKSILLYHNITVPRTHNTANLNNLLPIGVKNKIEHIFDELKKGIVPTIDQTGENVAESIKSHFIDWRYLDAPEGLNNPDNKTVQLYLSSLLTFLSEHTQG